jgi:phosphoglycerate kinase
MAKLTVKDVDLSGRTVLCRVDFNVPMEEGQISDDTRIEAALPTINYLRDSKLILCSHMGRPKGKPNPAESLAPCALRLSEKLGRPVTFVDDCVGPKVAQAVSEMAVGEVLLLENTRFYAGEESKDGETMMAFAAELAAPAEAYVNDAFGSSHRRHASVYGVTRYLTPAVAGLLVEREVAMLRQVYEAPREGFIAVLGGAKVADKIAVIKALLPRCEKMLIGGAMAWAFLKAQGKEIGGSLCFDESVTCATEILNSDPELISRLMLPIDVQMQNVDGDDAIVNAPADGIMPGWRARDIGAETAALYGDFVRQAKVAFWNGPMGMFEVKPFDQGTLAVAKAMGECPGFNVVGGGDSVAAVTQMKLEDKIDHVSTGGGASLEFLVDGDLPGVAALNDK